MSFELKHRLSDTLYRYSFTGTLWRRENVAILISNNHGRSCMEHGGRHEQRCMTSRFSTMLPSEIHLDFVSSAHILVQMFTLITAGNCLRFGLELTLSLKRRSHHADCRPRGSWVISVYRYKLGSNKMNNANPLRL